jgi:hypothetical protein
MFLLERFGTRVHQMLISFKLLVRSRALDAAYFKVFSIPYQPSVLILHFSLLLSNSQQFNFKAPYAIPPQNQFLSIQIPSDSANLPLITPLQPHKFNRNLDNQTYHVAVLSRENKSKFTMTQSEFIVPFLYEIIVFLRGVSFVR